MIGISDYIEAGRLQEKWEKEQERLNAEIEATAKPVNLNDKHALKLAAQAVEKHFGKGKSGMRLDVFTNKAGRKIEVNSIRIVDGGTLAEFEGFYLDNGEEINDDDYYYIQDNYSTDLDFLASEGY